MSNPTAARVSGAGLRPLSNAQKRELVLLARQAYGLEFPPPEVSFDDWRRQQCLLTVERTGLTACLNEDYLPLKAHWLRALGETAQADACLARAIDEPRNQALHALHRECHRAADVMPHAIDYAAGFIRNKRHIEIEDADAKTLWHALYTVRRRAAQLRKQQGGHP